MSVASTMPPTTGRRRVTLLITDIPSLAKVVALAVAGVALFMSYSGFQPGYEKAKIRAEIYSKMSPRYERLWNRINQGLDEESICAELDVLREQEYHVPAIPDEEYDDRLRERVYRILIESKGLAG